MLLTNQCSADTYPAEIEYKNRTKVQHIIASDEGSLRSETGQASFRLVLFKNSVSYKGTCRPHYGNNGPT